MTSNASISSPDEESGYTGMFSEPSRTASPIYSTYPEVIHYHRAPEVVEEPKSDTAYTTPTTPHPFHEIHNGYDKEVGVDTTTKPRIRKWPCSKPVLWLLLGLATAVVVIAIVGGVLGDMLASQNKKAAESLSSSTGYVDSAFFS